MDDFSMIVFLRFRYRTSQDDFEIIQKSILLHSAVLVRKLFWFGNMYKVITKSVLNWFWTFTIGETLASWILFIQEKNKKNIPFFLYLNTTWHGSNYYSVTTETLKKVENDWNIFSLCNFFSITHIRVIFI